MFIRLKVLAVLQDIGQTKAADILETYFNQEKRRPQWEVMVLLEDV
jgi:hypothetical protein